MPNGSAADGTLRPEGPGVIARTAADWTPPDRGGMPGSVSSRPAFRRVSLPAVFRLNAFTMGIFGIVLYFRARKTAPKYAKRVLVLTIVEMAVFAFLIVASEKLHWFNLDNL